MKYLKLILLTLFLAAPVGAQTAPSNPFQRGVQALSEGGVQGGGGDVTTELNIKNIRDDLQKFVTSGGAAQFDFEGRITRPDYEKGNEARKIYAMPLVLAPGAVTVVVIKASEQDRKNELRNTYVATRTKKGAATRTKKICKGVFEAHEDKLAYLICEKEAFEALGLNKTDQEKQDLQYKQIHHEYASLAGIETNIGQDSDYFLSRQIVRFFSTRLVRQVMARPSAPHLPMKWMPIAAKGVTFMMGSSAEEQGRDVNEDSRLITLPEDFEMMAMPVTQAQWVEVMGYVEAAFRKGEFCPSTYSSDLNGYCPDHPVENVRFVEICGANSYDGKKKDEYGIVRDHFSFKDDGPPSDCGRINGFAKRLNDLKDGWVYRLPTEAEWEYAARAGEKGPYPGGAKDASRIREFSWVFGDPEGGNSDFTDELGNHYGQTQIVGKKKPNAFGLYDMIGNVAQWTWDPIQVCRSIPKTAQGADTECSYYRVIRGASVTSNAGDARFARRRPFEPIRGVSASVGFRLVRTRAKK